MEIKTEYDIGDIVYLITDDDQKERIITGISIRPNNGIFYDLCCGATTSCHYEIEITYNKNWKI